MTDTTAPAAPPADEATEEDVFEQKAVRLAKRERLIAERADAAGGAYPVTVPVTDTIPGAARALRRPRGGRRDGRDGGRRRTGRLQPQHRQALLRDAAGGRRQPDPGDGVAGRRRRRVPAAVEGARRPRRSRLRERRGHLEPSRRAVDHGGRVGDRRRRRSCRCRTCTPSSAKRAGSAAASSTSSCATARARLSSPARRPTRACARRSPSAASSRSRRRCCRCSTAAPRRARS